MLRHSASWRVPCAACHSEIPFPYTQNSVGTYCIRPSATYFRVTTQAVVDGSGRSGRLWGGRQGRDCPAGQESKASLCRIAGEADKKFVPNPCPLRPPPPPLSCSTTDWPASANVSPHRQVPHRLSRELHYCHVVFGRRFLGSLPLALRCLCKLIHQRQEALRQSPSLLPSSLISESAQRDSGNGRNKSRRGAISKWRLRTDLQTPFSSSPSSFPSVAHGHRLLVRYQITAKWLAHAGTRDCLRVLGRICMAYLRE